MHVLYRPERLPVQGMQKRFSMDRGISTAVTLRFSQKILGALKKANGITRRKLFILVQLGNGFWNNEMPSKEMCILQTIQKYSMPA
jgi:hypothetical protein